MTDRIALSRDTVHFSSLAGLVDPHSPVTVHEACAAWAALPGQRAEPVSVAIEQARGSSAVYRLRAAGARGGDVIAKRAQGDSLEPVLYENLLPDMPVLTPQYLGSAVQGAASWIFLEDAGGSPYNWATADHRAAAGRWLGELHLATIAFDAVGTLPRRDTQYWAERLSDALSFASVLGRREHNSAQAADAVAGIIASCREMRSRWHAVEHVCGLVPETLIHGDLVPKNIRVLEIDDRVEVLPLDWGSAGHGVVPIDLAYVDPRAYWNVVHAHWPDLTLEDARNLSSLGRIFRTLLLVSWLDDERVESSAAAFDGKLTFYERWVRAELRRLRTVAE